MVSPFANGLDLSVIRSQIHVFGIPVAEVSAVISEFRSSKQVKKWHLCVSHTVKAKIRVKTWRIIHDINTILLASWCFEPSQPQMIVSRLETSGDLS